VVSYSIFFSSPDLSRRRLYVCHTCTHDLSANLGCRSETYCRRLTENTGRKNRHLCTIALLCRAESSQLRHASIIGKKLVKQQYLLHMSAQYGELRPTIAAEIGSGVWGTPANFNGFRVLALLLQGHRSPEANQTLHDVSPSPGLLHCVHFRGWAPLHHFVGLYRRN